MTGRLFTDAQLAELARLPAEELAEMGAAEAAPDAIAAWASSVERSWRAASTGYEVWIAHTIAWVTDRHGIEGAAAAHDATRRFFARQPGPNPPGPIDLVGALAASDPSERIEVLLRVEEEARAVHDVLRDWTSALLSHVYRRYAIDQLEEALRHAGERTLLAWMPEDISRPPAKRLVSWARMLRGHHTRFTLSELDDRFVIDQDPCGSCTRQILDGRYAEPTDLAIVAEPHLLTYGRGDTTIYRSHVPVMHQAMPMERIGVPWPVNRCPAGLATTACQILLFKDPLDPSALAELPGRGNGRDT